MAMLHLMAKLVRAFPEYRRFDQSDLKRLGRVVDGYRESTTWRVVDRMMDNDPDWPGLLKLTPVEMAGRIERAEG